MAVCRRHAEFSVVCPENDGARRDNTSRTDAADLVGIIFGEPDVIIPCPDEVSRLTGRGRSRKSVFRNRSVRQNAAKFPGCSFCEPA